MNRLKKKIILHMGAEKTGSTAIQHVLDRNRMLLREFGIRFPESAGSHINHTYLSVYAQDDDVFDNVKAHVLSMLRMDIKQFRNWFEQKFAAELSEGKPWSTIVLSTELIHSRITRPEEISRLKKLLAGFAADIKILIFIRRQDELALSRYSTAIRAGYDSFDDVFENTISTQAYFRLPPDRLIDDYRDYYNYRNVIERMSEIFGADTVKVALYPHSFGQGGLVRYFGSILGIDPDLLQHSDAKLNNAMSAEAQFVMASANSAGKIWKKNGERNQDMKDLHRVIESAFPGPPRQVRREDARSFTKRFEDSNEWVRARFFPERKTLFSTAYEQYPEAIDYSIFATRLAAHTATFSERAARLTGSTNLRHLRVMERFLGKSHRL
ncbi:hypothetical protein K1W69_07265 [Hoeflea sp. WL0058]|uniref:Uncharacterized protein n=1 Tax=Flavimaribacter sediminis TaxID=2865987 RepID=A0AAE3D0U6_9HYPH|nr:hypothetical protein [Flavimaribacter sediminis]MBW8636983.1 hypothetical protein [Flavimaribacter sediminis]